MRERISKKLASIITSVMVTVSAVLPGALTVAVVGVGATVITTQPVYAAPSEGDSGGADTSILPSDWTTEKILKFILNVLIYGLGALAVLGVVIAGIMYMTARDNEQQVARAKTRLIEVVIGLIAWALAFTVLNWLLPGGFSMDESGSADTSETDT